MHNKKKPWIFILYGPTAVGKTDISHEISKYFPVEIINMDVGQFYTPFSIGTAKPDWKNSSVPHHLFDIINNTHDFSVVDYREMALSVIHQIWRRDKIPLLVGGSGFYLKSFLFPPIASTRGLLLHDQEHNLWEQLNNIDPERAQAIDNNDTYRIKRALSIWQQTGKRPSEHVPLFDPPAPCIIWHLTRDRTELAHRINDRVVDMIEKGWIDEVERIRSIWEPFIMRKKLIGYNEIINYKKGQQSLESLVQLIQQRTRQYAKRQETFWRMIDRLITITPTASEYIKTCTLNLTSSPINLYIKQQLDTLYM